MDWLENIEINTLLGIELKNGKEFLINFTGVSDGIVEGVLQNGKIKKFREENIDSLEEIDTNNQNNEYDSTHKENAEPSSVASKEEISDAVEIEADIVLPVVQVSFLDKIENNVLSFANFDKKEVLDRIKNRIPEIYGNITSIMDSLENAIKINELDLKYNRTPRILKQVNTLLEKYKEEEIDLILAYILQNVQIAYFDFFGSPPDTLYCLKNDIAYCNRKNIKYGFILAERLFDLYYLNKETEKEWYYLVQKSIAFKSIAGLKFQEEYTNKLELKYRDLLRESLKYIAFNFKVGISKIENLHDGIEYLESNITPDSEYINLKNLKNPTIINDSKEKPTDDNILSALLPPNGIIEDYDIDEGKGYIRNKIGFRYFFNKKHIVDKKVLEKLEVSKHTKFEIFFLDSTKYGKKIAEKIRYPMTVKETLSEVNKLIDNRSFHSAEKILKQILSLYPNFQPAKTIYEKIKNKHIQKNILNKINVTTKMDSNLSNYKKARIAKENKDYRTAIEYFELALKNKERLDSTIKDLAITYYEIKEYQKEKELLEKYFDKLPKNITTYNFLENQYYALEEYDNALKYIDILLNYSPNNNKVIFLLGRKATIYLKTEKEKQAKKILQDILKMQPENTNIKNLLNQIEEGKFDKINMKDIESYFSTFNSGGLSIFMNNTLSLYEEYSGVPPAIRESKNFQKETLKSLRRLIDTAGRARPKERAGYLLSEAKLMQKLEPDRENQLRGVLAKYCNATALKLMSENSPKDTIRFYYLEAFSLEESWDSVSRQVSLYLDTYTKSNQELLNTRDYDVLSTTRELFELVQNHKMIWNAILDMFIVNKTIAKFLTQYFFKDKNLKNLSLEFLGAAKTQKDIDMGAYAKLWDEARGKRKIMYDNFSTSIKSLTNIDEIETFENQMHHVINGEVRSSGWLSRTDQYRLKILLEIHSMMNDYLKQMTFDDKERVKDNILTRVEEFTQEIRDMPTKISYDSYDPLLKNIKSLLLASFNDVIEASLPDVTIKTLADSVVVDKKKVSLQLYVENSKNSSPISNVEVLIIESDKIKFISGETEIYETLRGGHGKIIQIEIGVSDAVMQNLVTDMELELSYKTREEIERTKKKVYIPIRLYKSEAFIKIKNSYASVAEGGPVKDKSMFFGRDEYISNTVNALISDNAKSIIIYGQKRSGKSSVLHHLKKHLQAKENTFCISFSMGEIIQDLSVNQATFYYKILEKIEDELEILSMTGEETPSFQKPSIEEVEKYPSIVFNESLKIFIKTLRNMDTWKNKKLIIMIDEFTYIYSSIKKGILSPDFMKTWKAFIEKDYFSAVLVGQDVAPKFKMEYSNEFGVTEDQRLTYLTEADARELIEKPIWDKSRNTSRYVGDAVEKIIDYTACSPYYLQMFCARVVDYMNRKKAISVTESDIEVIAHTFIEGANSLPKDKFDNLFTAGDADIESFNLDEVEMILRIIAEKNNIGSCAREDIFLGNDSNGKTAAILNDLKSREVIEEKDRFYKIKVGLFQKWLLK